MDYYGDEELGFQYGNYTVMYPEDDSCVAIENVVVNLLPEVPTTVLDEATLAVVIVAGVNPDIVALVY